MNGEEKPISLTTQDLIMLSDILAGLEDMVRVTRERVLDMIGAIRAEEVSRRS